MKTHAVNFDANQVYCTEEMVFQRIHIVLLFENLSSKIRSCQLGVGPTINQLLKILST